MAVSACYGTVGSGKTYDAINRILEAMLEGRKVVTINMVLKYENIKRYLLEKNMSHYDSNQVIGEHEELFTENRFRELRGTENKRIYLVADEGHFWWPQNGHYKISLEDVLQVAMSRKKFLDLHLISQLNGQINREVSGLSSDNWLARPLKIEPFYTGLKVMSKVQRSLGLRGSPAAFFYIKLEDELGKTRGRKDGSFDPDNKKIRYLDPLIASCYDTLQIVSSPILDRMRDEAKFQYYVDILKGKLRPQATCPECQGTRIYKYVDLFDPVEGITVRQSYDKELFKSEWFLSWGSDDCQHCQERGYIYPDDHPDYEIAASMKAQLDSMFRRSGGSRAP